MKEQKIVHNIMSKDIELARKMICGYIERLDCGLEEKLVLLNAVHIDDAHLLEHIEYAIELLERARDEIKKGIEI